MQAPVEAEAVFGAGLAMAQRYAEWLVGPGIDWGLIGPREAPTLWDRHLLNCAVVAELLPPGARVVDVGSGAGLPGLALACARPDLRLDLVEPMARRCRFLTQVVDDLGIASRVRIWNSRADDAALRSDVGDAEFVTARAVAPLDRLVGWCLPLLAPGGRLLALKGSRAGEEATKHAPAVHRAGGRVLDIAQCGVGVVDPPVRVVVVQKADGRTPTRRRRGADG